MPRPPFFWVFADAAPPGLEPKASYGERSFLNVLQRLPALFHLQRVFLSHSVAVIRGAANRKKY